MNYLELKDLDNFFRGALYYLEEKRDTVNKLNVFPVPDGDTGTNMYLTLKTAIENLDKNHLKTLKSSAKSFVKERSLVEEETLELFFPRY